MKAAIYTRYSTDRQRETSTEDQRRGARARAQASGWAVVREYADEGISGTMPVEKRPSGARLLADAMAGAFDVLLIEGLDRLSRDSVEAERIVRRLEFAGLRIIGIADGYDSESAGRKLHRGMRGLINEIYLDDLREKTHRGLAGQVARGMFAGGLPYGYRSTEIEGGHRLEPHPDEAPWVAWIFERYIAGDSARAIAHALNLKRIPSPRGSTWALSAITGHAKYQTGILRNPIYIGGYIWNRSRWIKDPDTGTRKRQERPPSEWQRQSMPELRLVSDELWKAAERRLRGPLKRGKGAQVRSPFSGLLRCGCCGGPLIQVDKRAYGCGRNKDRGPVACPGLRVHKELIEVGLLAGIKADLLSDQAIAALRKEVASLMADKVEHAARDSAGARKRLAEVERTIANVVDAIAAVGVSQALRDRLASAEAERNALQAEIEAATIPAPAPAIVPGLVDRYRAAVADLPAIIRQRPAEAREALRELVGEVVITKEENGETWAELDSQAAVLLKAVAGARFNIQKRRRIRLACTR